MDQTVSIGDRLREERQRLDLNQTQMGESGGVTKKTQMLYEAGDRFPDAAYLAAVAKSGVNIGYVVTGEREGPPPIALTADEQVLLNGYRTLDGKTRKRVLAFILGGETSGKVIIHGQVGNQIEKNEGEIKIDMRSKK